MSPKRIAIGLVLVLAGAVGLAELGLLIYRPSAAHAQSLVQLGIPGTVLAGSAALLALIGGLGVLWPRRPGQG
jgi:hypothetical protein